VCKQIIPEGELFNFKNLLFLPKKSLI